MESDAAVFGLPSLPCRQRLLTRIRFSFHIMSAHRRAITSLARRAVPATVNTIVKYSVLVRDRRIMSVSSGVTVIALYVDLMPLSRQPLHGFEEQISSNNPY